MRFVVDLNVSAADAADIRRGLTDPQVLNFVIRMGAMMRRLAPRTEIVQFVEGQLFSWRLPPRSRRAIARDTE